MLYESIIKKVYSTPPKDVFTLSKYILNKMNLQDIKNLYSEILDHLESKFNPKFMILLTGLMSQANHDQKKRTQKILLENISNKIEGFNFSHIVDSIFNLELIENYLKYYDDLSVISTGDSKKTEEIFNNKKIIKSILRITNIGKYSYVYLGKDYSDSYGISALRREVWLKILKVGKELTSNEIKNFLRLNSNHDLLEFSNFTPFYKDIHTLIELIIKNNKEKLIMPKTAAEIFIKKNELPWWSDSLDKIREIYGSVNLDIFSEELFIPRQQNNASFITSNKEEFMNEFYNQKYNAISPKEIIQNLLVNPKNYFETQDIIKFLLKKISLEQIFDILKETKKVENASLILSACLSVDKEKTMLFVRACDYKLLSSNIVEELTLFETFNNKNKILIYLNCLKINDQKYFDNFLINTTHGRVWEKLLKSTHPNSNKFTPETKGFINSLNLKSPMSVFVDVWKFVFGIEYKEEKISEYYDWNFIWYLTRNFTLDQNSINNQFLINKVIHLINNFDYSENNRTIFGNFKLNMPEGIIKFVCLALLHSNKENVLSIVNKSPYSFLELINSERFLLTKTFFDRKDIDDLLKNYKMHFLLQKATKRFLRLWDKKEKEKIALVKKIIPKIKFPEYYAYEFSKILEFLLSTNQDSKTIKKIIMKVKASPPNEWIKDLDGVSNILMSDWDILVNKLNKSDLVDWKKHLEKEKIRLPEIFFKIGLV